MHTDINWLTEIRELDPEKNYPNQLNPEKKTIRIKVAVKKSVNIQNYTKKNMIT